MYGGGDFESAKSVSENSGTIKKEVTKSEQVNVSSTGGEIWENKRFIGVEEEQLITTNTVLSLPPMVAAFTQPQKLVQLNYSSFVTVNSFDNLKEFLKSRAHKKETIESELPEKFEDDLFNDEIADDEVNDEPVSDEPVSDEPVSDEPVSDEEKEKEKNRERRERQKQKKKKAKEKEKEKEQDLKNDADLLLELDDDDEA